MLLWRYHVINFGFVVLRFVLLLMVVMLRYFFLLDERLIGFLEFLQHVQEDRFARSDSFESFFELLTRRVNMLCQFWFRVGLWFRRIVHDPHFDNIDGFLQKVLVVSFFKNSGSVHHSFQRVETIDHASETGIGEFFQLVVELASRAVSSRIVDLVDVKVRAS